MDEEVAGAGRIANGGITLAPGPEPLEKDVLAVPIAGRVRLARPIPDPGRGGVMPVVGDGDVEVLTFVRCCRSPVLSGDVPTTSDPR